jgi:DNA invertase Pin-like site-specific DNA recombinase
MQTKFTRTKGEAAQFIAYYRVSTQKQGRSGLGMEAQRECVAAHVEAARGVVLNEYTETESGKSEFRPELLRALHEAKTTGAVLIVAKLDRLSRSVRFIYELKESGVQFVACDLPDFNTLTVGIIAAFAQHEREQISKRTKAALDAKRARVGEWRSGNLTDEARTKGHAKNRLKSRLNMKARAAAMYLHSINQRGEALSLRAKADLLNAAGFETPKKCSYNAVQVSRLEAKMPEYIEAFNAELKQAQDKAKAKRKAKTQAA